MADNISLIVNETIDNVVINPTIISETIDVNVSGTDTYVDISVTPNLTTVNINNIEANDISAFAFEKETFTYSSTNIFSLQNSITNILQVIINSTSLHPSAYSYTNPNIVTILNDLVVGDIITIIYNYPEGFLQNPDLSLYSKFAQVNTYALMVAIPTPINLLIVKVLNDENKGITNAIYHLYPDGVRMWIAAVED